MGSIQWAQGNTYEQLGLTLQTQNGSAINLSSVSNTNIQLALRPNYPVSLSATLGGSVTITNAPAGQIAYLFAASDVAVIGQYWLEVWVNFGGSGYERVFETFFVIQRAM